MLAYDADTMGVPRRLNPSVISSGIVALVELSNEWEYIATVSLMSCLSCGEEASSIGIMLFLLHDVSINLASL